MLPFLRRTTDFTFPSAMRLYRVPRLIPNRRSTSLHRPNSGSGAGALELACNPIASVVIIFISFKFCLPGLVGVSFSTACAAFFSLEG